MPVVIKTNVIATVAGLPVIPLTPPPIELPELWTGMQFFFDFNWAGAFDNPLYPADHAVAAWKNKWGYRLFDAADRLRWTASDGVVRNHAHRYNGNGGNNGWPTVSSTPARLNNNKKTLTSKGYGEVVYVPGDPVDSAASAALMTTTYTYVMVYKGEAGATGGMFGQSPSSNHDAATAGLRFGWKSVANEGKTIFQHLGTAANRIEIDRDTANGKVTIVVITCSGTTGNIHIENGGVISDHPFTFESSQSMAGTINGTFLTLGALDGSAGTAKFRDISHFSRWNRVLTSTELTYLYGWMRTKYGPFN